MINLQKAAWRYCTIVLVGLSFLVLAASAQSQEAETEKAILVLDASGSMWGQVDGTPKISIARGVIQHLLDDWNPKVQLGLVAYGHREKGSCADIQTLAPVGPIDKSAIMSAIEGLNPKGKTPLTSAVRQAAEALRYTEERTTVILVSDGKETCEADPCAVAAELEANGIDFAVHVIGFDLAEEEKGQLQCIANNTGGKFLSADNASELHQAMATTVQMVAEPAAPPKKKVIKVDVAAPGAITVRNAPEYGYIYDQNNDEFWVKVRPDKTAQVPAGTYRLEISPGIVVEDIEIEPGENEEVDVAALYGWITVKSAPTYGHIYDQSNKNFWIKVRPDKTAHVRTGTYRLEISPGIVVEDIEIEPGTETILDMSG